MGEYQVRIKVCGLTKRDDIREACRLGVDALGFILAASPRKVLLSEVSRMFDRLPPFVSRVAVVVNPSRARLDQIIASHLFDYIQFHGEEEVDLLKRAADNGPGVIKAISVKAESDLALIEKYRNYTDYFLFDNSVKAQRGGTGTAFNWSLLNDYQIGKPFILAGGLGPVNVLDAVQLLKPAAVDLNSKIESRPGKKDFQLLQKVVDILKN